MAQATRENECRTPLFHFPTMRRSDWVPAALIALLLVSPGSNAASATGPRRPPAPRTSEVPPPKSSKASRPAPPEASEGVIPNFDRFFGTWLWLQSEGVVGVSTPDTRRAARTLILNPDLSYEFHERRDTRDSVLCRGRFLISEQSGGGGGPIDLIDFQGWFETYERRMFADFEGPDTLNLVGFPCENCPDHTFVRGQAATLHGEVKLGEGFRRDLWNGLRFELTPIPLGWEIAVRDTTRPAENLARLTLPLQGPNPHTIEGWHFRNPANTGPNRGEVNAPQEERGFIFSPEVGRSIQGPSSNAEVGEDEIERVADDGRGVLTIEEMKLTAPRAGERAGIESMRFTVAIEEAIRTPRRP